MIANDLWQFAEAAAEWSPMEQTAPIGERTDRVALKLSVGPQVYAAQA
jgi:hypothetical protein